MRLASSGRGKVEIKRALGKLRIPTDLAGQLTAARFSELPLRLRRVNAFQHLPDLHRDPFDRMLVAQAEADDLTLVTHDRQILAFPVRTLAV